MKRIGYALLYVLPRITNGLTKVINTENIADNIKHRTENGGDSCPNLSEEASNSRFCAFQGFTNINLPGKQIGENPAKRPEHAGNGIPNAFEVCFYGTDCFSERCSDAPFWQIQHIFQNFTQCAIDILDCIPNLTEQSLNRSLCARQGFPYINFTGKQVAENPTERAERAGDGIPDTCEIAANCADCLVQRLCDSSFRQIQHIFQDAAERAECAGNARPDFAHCFPDTIFDGFPARLNGGKQPGEKPAHQLNRCTCQRRQIAHKESGQLRN